MAKPRVYVETTIPSFYHEMRTAADIVARREWTRLWWRGAPERYHLVTSPAVLDELRGGPPEWSAERLALVQDLVLCFISMATYSSEESTTASPFETALQASSGRTDS